MLPDVPLVTQQNRNATLGHSCHRCCRTGLALVAPLERLAEWASLSTLAVFALVNLSLLWLRWRGIDTRRGEISIPVWVPLLGFVCCIGMLASAAV